MGSTVRWDCEWVILNWNAFGEVEFQFEIQKSFLLRLFLCSRNWKVADMNWKWLKANWKISNLSNRPWVIFNSYQGIIIISDDYNSARRFVTAYGRIAHRGSLMWVRFELDLGGVMIINGDLKWFLTVPMIQTDQDEFIASYIELNQLHHKFKRISLVWFILFLVELLLV